MTENVTLRERDRGLVERLAEKWDDETGYLMDSDTTTGDVRWWLLAIEGDPECPEHVRRWLRAQAKGDDQ
jgi:hypothetical protein